jgi:hypothetical protein
MVMTEEQAPYGVGPPATCGYTEHGSPEALGKLYAALADAQSHFGEIHRSREVKAGSYSFRYAPLEDLLAATRPALAAQGLAVLTPIVSTDGVLARVLATIVHKDGARLAFAFAFKATGAMKDIGGQVTYARRYAYSALLNLAADDDEDDVPSETQARQRQQPKREPPAPIQQAAAPTTQDVADVNRMAQALAEHHHGPDLGPAVAPPPDAKPSSAEFESFGRGLKLAEELRLDLAAYEFNAQTITKRDLLHLSTKLKKDIDAKRDQLTAQQPALT